jgi:hypothetical protein
MGIKLTVEDLPQHPAITRIDNKSPGVGAAGAKVGTA